MIKGSDGYRLSATGDRGNCPSRKAEFPSRRAAKVAAKFHRRQAHGPLYPYRCSRCAYWHLTSQVLRQTTND